MTPRYSALALAVSASLSPFAASAADDVDVALRDTVSIDCPDATAAFAVDTGTVEATLRDGQLALTGRNIGRTLVTIVRPTGVTTLAVNVGPAAKTATVLAADEVASGPTGDVTLRYDSGTRRWTTGLVMATLEGDRATRLHLQGMRDLTDAEGPVAFPQASLEVSARGRSLVLLDKRVEASPLTLDGTVLRGVHVSGNGLELHGGVASPTPWEDGLWPRGDRAFGISHHGTRGALRLVPSLYWFPDSDTDVPGVASLRVERGEPTDAWHWLGELGWSGAPGASMELGYRAQHRQARLQASHRPQGFAALDSARPAGTYLDGSWWEELGEATTLDAAVSYNALELQGRRTRAATGRLDLRRQVSDDWALSAGIGAAQYGDEDRAPIGRRTATLGAQFSRAGLGMTAQYRYEGNSVSARGGHGGRLSLRMRHGGWSGSGYVDVQQQAVTLDLLLRPGSDLSRAFAQLGVNATTPEQVLAFVRDNATVLSDHGVEVGSLRTDPVRLQGGLDVSWRSQGARATRFGVRLMATEARGIDTRRQSYFGNAFASWRVFGNTEIEVGYTRMAGYAQPLASRMRGSFQLALRTNLSGLRLPGRGRAITGRVETHGPGSSPAPAPLPGVEVALDGGRRVRTDAQGRFEFRAPGKGVHEVSVQLPSEPGAFFNSPSIVRAEPGDYTRFSIAFAASRLSGIVRNDAGLPMAGVSVRFEGSGGVETVTTDSDGHYVIQGGSGMGQVSLVADSIPAGHELAGLASEEIRLAPGAPAKADFTVRAQRSATGKVSGLRGTESTLTILESGRRIEVDDAGRFLLRSLDAGRFTLVVRNHRGETRREVVVPEAAGMLPEIELSAP